MALVQFKPTSPGRRNQSGYTFDEITKTEPEKSLIAPRKRPPDGITGGCYGSTPGGGVKQSIRKIDFKRDKLASG